VLILPRGKRAFWVLAVVAIATANAQAPFPMKYLGDVGHLGGLDPRTSANLGFARVFPGTDGDLRFEGRDAAGRQWHVWFPAAPGVGATDVWTADFDHNGHPDLLISAMFPRNGRCTDGTIIYILMFDQMGRPVPWVMPSHTFDGYGRPPLGVLQRDGNGRADIVAVDCEYSDQLATGVMEDRQISGIYEARDARWYPIRNTSDRSYMPAVNPHPRQSSRYARWLPIDAAKWPDFLAGYDDRPLTQLRSMITGAVGCGGMRLPIVDGRGVSSADDPCDSLKYDQVVFSDGEPRQGWPFVVIDSPDSRDVFLSGSPTPLVHLLKMGYRFRVLGENPRSPSLLWADSRASTEPAHMSSRLRTWEQNRLPIVVEENLPEARPGTQDIIVNAEQRCFALRSTGENAVRVAELRDCPANPRLIAHGLEPPAGTAGSVSRVVTFGEWWQPPGPQMGQLAEWRSGARRWLVLHSADGRPLTGEMALPVDFYLVESVGYEGVSFLRWENDSPAELVVDLAAVEWSRTPQ
jgi:hypothetical protein